MMSTPLQAFMQRRKERQEPDPVKLDNQYLKVNLMRWYARCAHCGIELTGLKHQANTSHLVGDRLACPGHITHVQAIVDGFDPDPSAETDFRPFVFAGRGEITEAKWQLMRVLVAYRLAFLLAQHGLTWCDSLKSKPKDVIKGFQRQRGAYRWKPSQQQNLLQLMFVVVDQTVTRISEGRAA